MTPPAYSAVKQSMDGIEVVRLSDTSRRTEVSIVPSIGNIAFELKVNGWNILWMPPGSLAQFQAKPAMGGIPFLAPWANRLSEDGYYAAGRKYMLNPRLGNLRRDQNQHPIHGLLLFSTLWKVAEIRCDGVSAHVTSRLEFWKYPELMAQFPFAHTITMTHRLSDGVLEIETLLENQSAETMPVAIGFHPYFQLHDAPRDEWKLHLAARDHVQLSEEMLPTGNREPISFPDPLPLAGRQLDDVFTGLDRGAFRVEGRSERISVVFGEKYTVAVIYAPAGRDFICIEPMSAITDAFNLAHSGAYRELQTIPPGAEWRESFRIVPGGF